MRGRFFRWRAAASVASAFLIWAVSAASAQPDAPQATAAIRDAEERAGCTQNLKTIFQAIQGFQRDRKALPLWLSDLVPQYLEDANTLICPVCRRTGQTETRTLSDPKLPCSYIYEFSPAPLGSSYTNIETRTHREWKQRQMGLVGSIVPIVRCRHHKPLLNLAFDGSIYDSGPAWERLLTNQIPYEDLTPAKIFAGDPAPSKSAAKAKGKGPKRFEPRDSSTPKELLDLSGVYNASLNDSWHGGSGNDLASLPKGVHIFDSVKFDARGIVQLASKSSSSTNFPVQVQGIKVNRKCEHIHFLHAAGFGALNNGPNTIGWYVLRFANDQMRLQIPIRYGRDVQDWHTQPNEGPLNSDLTVAWIGENTLSKRMTNSIRLFTTTWTNVAPAVEIESMDFVSAMAGPAPFLIAITVD